MKCIPAQRTAAGVAAFEPPVQATPMEHIPARAAAFARQLPVAPDDAVADRALGLAFQGCRYVPPPALQAIDQRAPLAAFAHARDRAGEIDHGLCGHQPREPFLFVDGDTMDGFDGGAGEGIRGGESNGNLHVLLVDGNAGGDFTRGEGDFDVQRLVGGGL